MGELALHYEVTADPDAPPAVMDMWTVYDHPSDYPNGYLARRWIIVRENGKTEHLATKTAMAVRPRGQWADVSAAELRQRMLTELRIMIRQMHPNATRMERSPEDDVCIVEVWI